MGTRIIPCAGALIFAVCGPAAAATFSAEIHDQDGRPVANAVIVLLPDSKASMPASATRLAAEKTIDQRGETFIPLVTIVPKGGHIVFANNDPTTHQVYSFSAVKQFEITLARGEKSPPIAFDNSGVAALGCNIHDHMIAYAFVVESPWAMLSGSDGRGTIADVPPGNYEAQVWHPKLPPGRAAQSLRVSLSGDTARLAVNINLLPTSTMSHG